MPASFRYDQDPRYGWFDIDLSGVRNKKVLIVIDNNGYEFNRDTLEMVPTCVCYARHSSECCCNNLPDDYWD